MYSCKDISHIDTNLYVGSSNAALDPDIIKRHNIKYVVNATKDVKTPFEDFITYMRIPVNDGHSDEISTYFNKTIEFINEARHKNGNVLIHCYGGISRSVTLATAYIMKKYAFSMNKALGRIQEKRPRADPNFNFMVQLLNYEKAIQAKKN
uniref:Dual specificity phosphatase, catalytic domain protein n=1 Tax=Megaviridae environmental sample TaxID=1737588 RepID=A0A5J6VKF4_9VIRU|nr:MAG: dual specificity phosphatase, catalytic domain protein [Megaviridae environmental sample]